MKTKRLLAYLLTLTMLMTIVPIYAAAEESSANPSLLQDVVTEISSDTKENTNQAGGIIYTKTSTAKSDGTIDITLTAHTTGVVRQLTSVTPTDIVLVLDASGSMDDNYTTTRITGYNEATGSEYTYTTGWFGWGEEHTAYGLERTSSTYYINTGTEQEPVYTRVAYTGRDENGFEMYEYSVGNTEVIIYPVLSGVISAERQYPSYNVVQLYSATVDRQTVKKMTSLQNAVKTFIEATAQMNQGLEADQMHNISIVKFANDSYYNSSVATVTEGNNRGYSQVVKNLTPVDSDGAAVLKAAVDAISPNGATAVDYGLNLAQAVLMNRSAVTDEGAVDRKEVVIVFSDGSPTYGLSFQNAVANRAITVAGNMKSDADVTIYSVCIDTNADATDIDENINKFMHYVSSNYPDAKNMTTPGETGSTNNGYYLTPDSTTSLLMIFESIIQDIDHPTITMGEEATMVDTISPYFDFQGDVEDVKLQTSARNSDGTWADPVDDQNLVADITNDRLIVDGFDFDANYVSETGRGDNDDFYGKRLVVSFTVVPDYDVIDIASATLMGGILPTNSGFAALVDSDSAPAAQVPTPELPTHQVTYMVGEDEYATYNRFTGSDVEVDAVPTKVGYTFSGWTIDGEEVDPGDIFTMPNEDVEIVGTFTANTYDVTYAYTGATPANATDLQDENYNGNSANVDVAYGSTVTVAPDATAPGYIFSGWRPLDQSVIISEGNFTMPDHPVTLIGSFTPDNTPYRVIHYTETFEDGVYEIRETENFAIDTDATATAIPKYYPGFTFDDTKVEKMSGTVTASPMLVLELYYNRNSYEVTYSYTGDVPENPPAHPGPETYKYGETVTVANDVEVVGYTFGGWESLSISAQAGQTFNMPANNVAFIGEFTANSDTEYEVQYYLENLAGEYELNEDAGYINVGTTGSTVYANRKEFEGFTFEADNPNNRTSGVIKGDGSLILKLYYTRNEYTVTYAYESNEPQPEGAPELTEWIPETYKFGQLVTVEDDLYIEGFDFIGWHSSGYTVDVDTEEFLMPARDVILYGDFEAGDVRWVEKHFFETLDEGVYPDEPDRMFEHIGTTGDPVSAVPIADLVGFELDTSHPDYLPSVSREDGGIDAGGNTELRFYYKRKAYTVKYVYDPADQPTGAEELLPAEATYRYGETATVEDAPELQGYTFVGWYPEQTVVLTSGTFEMPAYNVVFEGDFNPRNDTRYEVHHHLQNADGTYPDDPNYINEHTGVTGEEVTAIPRNFTGYVLSSEDPVKGNVEADGSLILDLFYDRTTYNVTYFVTGFVPTGVEAPVDSESPYRHGDTVEVLPVLDAPAGFVFTGWNPVSQSSEEDTVIIDDNMFTMPMHNVRLVGNFSAATNTPYAVRHFTQKEDLSGYELYRNDERVGTTGDPLTVYALIIPGFKNVTTVDDEVVSTQTANILGDGSLVIEFYYDRNLHDVTYVYEGIAPDRAPDLDGENYNGNPANGDVPFGREITVADAPNVPGYTFVGWYIDEDTNIVTSFDMPDNDVVLKGKFSSNLVDYTVNYWLQNIDDADYTLDSSYTEEAFVGQHIEAISKSYTGFTLNTSESTTFGHVTVNEDGVGNLILNLYYDRHTYNVTYGYYGEQPENAPDLSGYNKTNVRFGTELDVEEKPELAGYAFDGWYTRTATVVGNEFTMPDHDVAFLGRFVEQFTVSYDLNNGTGADGVDYSAEVVDAGTQITVKAAPTRSGYTFKGWEEGSNKFDPDEVITVDRNVHLVAKWSRNGGGGGGTTRYTLTYETNGGNEIAKETYNSGTTAKLTKVPVKDGYVFEGWHLDEALTEDVTEVKMTKNITVYAAWVEDNGNAGNGHETPGSLNGEDHFAYVVGYPDGTVRPNDNISRAEVTSIFFRLLKPDEVRDKNLTDENNFADVNTADWYNTAISTMAKLGIVNGRTEESFVPNAFITRAEFAAICARFDNSEYEIVDNFTDVNGHWAENEIHEAAAHGWIRGYDDGSFKPDQFITRAEAMTMINRVLNRVPETVADLLDSMVKWPDNSDETAWYYLPVQEATNSHDYDMKNHIYEKWTALRDVTDWTKYE